MLIATTVKIDSAQLFEVALCDSFRQDQGMNVKTQEGKKVIFFTVRLSIFTQWLLWVSTLNKWICSSSMLEQNTLYLVKSVMNWQFRSLFWHISYISVTLRDTQLVKWIDFSRWRPQEAWDCALGSDPDKMLQYAGWGEERDLQISSSKPLWCSSFQLLLGINEWKMKGSDWLLLWQLRIAGATTTTAELTRRCRCDISHRHIKQKYISVCVIFHIYVFSRVAHYKLK